MHKAEALFLLCQNASNLHSAVLCGSPNRHQERVNKAIKDPGPGQLAFEQTGLFLAAKALHSGDPDRALMDLERRIGRIAKVCREPIMTEEQFVEAGYAPGERPTEQVTYLDALCGTQIRWTNASFLRILETSTWNLEEETRKADKV